MPVFGLETVLVPIRGPSGVDGADGGLGEDGSLYPGHREVFGLHGLGLIRQLLGAGPHLKEPQFVASGLSTHPASIGDGDGFTFLQAYAATEIGGSPVPFGEGEDSGSLQEKVPALLEAEGETGQVHPPLIDLHLSEVGVDAQG